MASCSEQADNNLSRLTRGHQKANCNGDEVGGTALG